MQLTFIPTFTDFRAGERAPTLEQIEAHDLLRRESGLLIINELGTMALRVTKFSPEVELDDAVEPMEIRFNRAPLEASFGFTIPRIGFVRRESESYRTMLVTGSYTGPLSELRTAAIPTTAVEQFQRAA